MGRVRHGASSHGDLSVDRATAYQVSLKRCRTVDGGCCRIVNNDRMRGEWKSVPGGLVLLCNLSLIPSLIRRFGGGSSAS